MPIKEEISETIGKTVHGVVVHTAAEHKGSPVYSIRFVFDDNTFYEIWGDDVHSNRSMHAGNIEKAADQLRKRPGDVDVYTVNLNRTSAQKPADAKHSNHPSDYDRMKLTRMEAMLESSWIEPGTAVIFFCLLLLSSLASSWPSNWLFSGFALCGIMIYGSRAYEHRRLRREKWQLINRLEAEGFHVFFGYNGIPEITREKTP